MTVSTQLALETAFSYINIWAMIWRTDYLDDYHPQPQADTALEPGSNASFQRYLIALKHAAYMHKYFNVIFTPGFTDVPESSSGVASHK